MSATVEKEAYLKLQNVCIDLQGNLLETKARSLELGAKCAELIRQNDELRKRSAEPGHYSLYEVSPGVVVMKFNRAAGEPVHYLCPDCFSNDRSKVFLQGDPNDWRRRCQRCQVSFWFGPPKAPEPETAAPASGPESEPQAAATPETETDSSASLAQEWEKHGILGPMVREFQNQMNNVKEELHIASVLHQRVRLAKIGAVVDSLEGASAQAPAFAVLPARDETDVRLERIRQHVDKLIEGLGGGATP